MGDVLASGGFEGRGRLRKARGNCQTSVDPGIPELTYTESRGVCSERGELKHLSNRRKRKKISISPVAASEKESAQTVWLRPCGVVGLITVELQNCVLEESDGKRNRSG